MNDIRLPWCSHCRATFPMRESMFDNLERSGDVFYCPAGHRLVFLQDSIVSQLRSSERHLQRSEEHITRLYKEAAGLRGVITRRRNRLLNGDCPYCCKSGGDIMRHIRERHGE